MKTSVYLTFILLGLVISVKSYGFADDEFGVDTNDCKSINGCNNNERSQSISSKYDDDDQHFYDKNSDEKLLKNAKLVSAKPAITRSTLYVSPEEIQHTFIRHRRNPQTEDSKNAKEDYDKSYHDFVSEHFPSRITNNNNGNKKSSSYKSADVEDIERPKDKSGFGFLYKYPSDEYERIKDLSDQQAKEIQETKGTNCKVIEKDKMVCHICSDPKSGAKSESCSYSSKPEAKKYAYLKEKSYNSKDDENVPESTEKKVKAIKKSANKSSALKVEPIITASSTRSTATPIKSERLRTNKPRVQQQKQKTTTTNENRPQRGTKPSERRPQRDVLGLDPYLYGSSDDYKEKTNDDVKPKTFEQYYTHVFPKETKENYKQQQQQQKNGDDSEDDAGDKQFEYIPKYNTKSNVDTVLAEFNKKDWSACKKVYKEKLTCYQCKDKNGVNYEECMYISDTDPKSSRLVYEESKRFYETGKPSENDKKTNEQVKDRIIDPKNNYESDNDEEEEIEEREAEASSYTTVKTFIEKDNKKNNKKRFVVKKRKTTKSDFNLKPEENDENDSEKRTIKRTVKIQESDNFDPDTSRSIRYEQSVSHTSI